ncbi:MAG: ester cyclase [Bacteroidota bacterium]
MIYSENTVYQLDGQQQDLPGFDEKYANIVDYVLKITDEIWEQRAIWVINETYTEDVLVHVGGRKIIGIEPVITGTLNTLASFPDRTMGGETVIWAEDEPGQFFSSHRIASTVTNLGATEYGAATGQKAFFRTIADCLIRDNKIYEEWLVRDNLALLQQLGYDPTELAKKDQRYAKQAPQDTTPQLSVHLAEVAATHTDSTIARVAQLFDQGWHHRQLDTLSDYYAEAVKAHVPGGQSLAGLANYADFLTTVLAAFPQATFKCERITCNHLEEETEVAVRWKIIGQHTGEGFFGAPSGQRIVLPGISHFKLVEDKIVEEWLLFDGYDALCQIHRPAAEPREDTALANKKRVHDFFRELNTQRSSAAGVQRTLREYLSPDVTLNVTDPYEPLVGQAAFYTDFWAPLLHAFPDLDLQPYILMGGEYAGRQMVCSTGNWVGTFRNDWLGIPAHQQATWIRYASHFLLDRGRITHAWFYLDVLDVMRQAGYHFFPNRGIEWVPPAPQTGDGLLLSPTPPEQGQKSLALVNAMLDGLSSWDQKTLESMGQTRFWAIEDMMWYGPSGIGTTRGLQGFQDYHQVPFITAFPDRGITPKDDTLHFAQLGDGHYAYDFGFPSMYGTHLAGDWLGLAPTGTRVTMRVTDFWRREGDRLVENWVFIDMIHLTKQLGVDVFALLAEAVNAKRPNLET